MKFVLTVAALIGLVLATQDRSPVPARPSGINCAETTWLVNTTDGPIYVRGVACNATIRWKDRLVPWIAANGSRLEMKPLLRSPLSPLP